MDSSMAQAGICRTQKRLVMEIIKPNQQRDKMFQVCQQIYCAEHGVNPGEDSKILEQRGSFVPIWLIQAPSSLIGTSGKACGTASLLPHET